MSQKDNILQELKDLESLLRDLDRRNLFHVPAGYFESLAAEVMARIRSAEEGLDEDGKYLASFRSQISRDTYRIPAGYFDELPGQVMRRIKALEAGTAVEELKCLSPLVSELPRDLPYTVPQGYFQDLPLTAAAIAKANDKQPGEELEAISPLLGGLKKEMPFSVPEGYFENLDRKPVQQEKPSANVVSMTGRKWFRYAAAAVVTGVIAMIGFLVIGKKNKIDPNEQSYEWVAKNLKKISENDIDSFVQMVNPTVPVVASNTPKIEAKEGTEVMDLIKDIPEEALRKFLDETEPLAAEENSDDIFMN